MPASDTLLVDIADGVAVVTMHRPEVRNALDAHLRRNVPATLAELDASPDVRAMILTGSDPAFCAGLDLKALASTGLGNPQPRPDREPTAGAAEPPTDSPLPFAHLTKPLIGAINGVAVTGGLEYALNCDFLIASDRARFADTHARVGVMPGWGLTVLLPQAIGRRRAHQMSFTGNYVGPDTALDWGLVNEVVPHEELIARARELAIDMASVPVDHLVAIKTAYQVANAPFDSPAIDAEQAYSNAWARSFDPAAFGTRRAQIEKRGREQQEQ